MADEEQSPVTEVAPGVIVIRPDYLSQFLADLNAQFAAGQE